MLMTDDVAKIRFDTTVICDDARLENSGKSLLIGVYHGDITVPRFPAQFMITVFSMGEVTEPGVLAIPLLVTDQDGTVVFRSEDLALPPKANFIRGPFAIHANAIISLNKETILRFHFLVDGQQICVAQKRVATVPLRPKG
jgi:hypothetical protein